MRHAAIEAALRVIALTGAGRLAAPFTGGIGAILTLHHVRPADPRGFAPNAVLEVTPEFLDAALTRLARGGRRFVSLAEAVELVARGVDGRPFVALTFDDGARDVAEHALPVLRRHAAPATLFVTTGFADGSAFPWWSVLEAAIGALPRVRADLGDARLDLPAGSDAEKARAFATLYAPLRAGPHPRLLRVVAELADQAGLDTARLTRRWHLAWDELAALAADPLLTFGAHTRTHPILTRLSDEDARDEMVGGAAEQARRLGRAPEFFAYPVGSPDAAGPREFALAAEAGFAAAVTTRPGVLRPAHAATPHALPRLSVNGLHQDPRSLEALLSGLPTLALDALRSLRGTRRSEAAHFTSPHRGEVSGASRHPLSAAIPWRSRRSGVPGTSSEG